VAHKGLYQPRIADASIRKLYYLAKRHGIKMTQLLNLIVSTAIAELEHSGDVCDEAPVAPVVAPSPTCGIFQSGLASHAQARRSQSHHHDRPAVRYRPHVRERHQRKKV